jgi:hypothetical protein
MVRPVEVFGGVLVLGRIATSDMPAVQANSQMYPTVAHLDALFANVLLWLEILGIFQVFADVHVPLPAAIPQPFSHLL